MKRRRSIRTGIAAIGVLCLVAVGSVSATPTEAAWTEQEFSKATSISAVELKKPTITSCQVGSLLGLLVTSLSFTWTSTLPPEFQRHYLNDTLGTAIPTVTGPNAQGVYTYSVSYDSALLELVLSLLAANVQIKVNTAGGTWSSESDHWEARKFLVVFNCRAVT